MENIETNISELANFFKAVSDETRVKIILCLEKHKELCVRDISNVLNMSISAISHQLAILKQKQLVITRRDGMKIFYSLHDKHVSQVLTIALEHIKE